ncbi:MAG: ATP-dependent Clp protease ATP-binding subunit [Puniceicoccales bacterium]|jgi:ATP-dependent Clp protease ATP-binding subunit ClpC|nr:ATP-dependent Clp protease ATP-binding subunit [Puniceicoccales bacterium]
MEEMHRFTPRVQHVLNGAREEANQLGHGEVRSEHLLLALLKISDCTAIELLRSFGLEVERVREVVLRHLWSNETGQDRPWLGTNIEASGSGPTEIAPDARAVVLLAAVEAHALGHEYIGTEHLLLGFLRESEGVAGKVLRELGLEMTACREEIEELNANDGEEEAEEGELPAAAPVVRGDTANVRPPNALSTFARNLTEAAREGKLDPVIGRTAETERCIQILCRRTKNNPVLLGDAGVGKTAIVEGLARAIVGGNVPEILLDRQIFILDLPLMVAGTKFRGQFEERLKAVMTEVRERKEIILFLDELHTVVGAGSGDGSMDAANILKPALSRGELQCIGATTYDEYRRFIEKDPALERRFQPIAVEEPSYADSLAILCGLKEKYEEHHGVCYEAGTLEAAVRLSSRHIGGRQLPDKAIDVMDEAGALVRLRELNLPVATVRLRQRRDECQARKLLAAKEQNFELAARMRDAERQLTARYESALAKRKRLRSSGRAPVTEEDVRLVVSRWAKIPLDLMAKSRERKFLQLREKLQGTVVGQEEAIVALDRALRRSQAQLHDPNRPLGSFLFLGPSGVGKTLLARQLAANVFGREEDMIRVDMSEYMEKFNATRMLGSPPGYVGHEEGGQLTERIRRRPHSVVLFDEIEKAHPDVLQLLLQVLEDGRLTDNLGRTVSFRSAIVIMTSNIGSEFFLKNSALGFGHCGNRGEFERVRERVLGEVRHSFRPEFLGRFTEILTFRPLGPEQMEKIVDLELAKLRTRMEEKGYGLILSGEAKKLIVDDGVGTKEGARAIRRTMERLLEDPLAEKILEVDRDGRFRVDAKDGKMAIEFSPTRQVKRKLSQLAKFDR